jgi:hypothetical protein
MYKKPFLLLILTLLTCGIFAATRSIHVVVALCDNKNQGIVPVPERIGNGQDPANNLYWGCGYGVKTFFKKQPEWKLVKTILKPESYIYERLVFKHRDSSVYLIADAYDGAFIKQTTIDLFDYSAGLRKQTIVLENGTCINLGGEADLICYIGHDGLMEFNLDNYPLKSDNKKRDAIILACASRNFYAEPLKSTGAYPLLWTNGLMCPEAYTLHSAIADWISKKSEKTLHENAAQTYHRFQKCGINGARNLFTSGW